jgi:phospholipase C
MDHWDLGDTANANDKLAFSQYYEADIPNYWQYARNFSLADHFHSSMLGPSFPGHMFFLAAQSGWALGNPSGGLIFWGCDQNETQQVEDQVTCMPKSVKACYQFPTIVDNLPPSVTWKFYGSALPPVIGEVWSMFDAVDKIRNGPGWKNIVTDPNFDTDVDNGTLPNISFLVDQDTASEHPPLRICDGENWTVNHLNHVMKSPLWGHVAILMSWDDFGGWYDHVAPPKQYGCDSSKPYGLGFRLPLIIVSPYVKAGTVYHNVSQQASIPKFIETIFGLPSLNSQDPAAQDGPDTDDLTAAFDWTQTPIAPLMLTPRDCSNQR